MELECLNDNTPNDTENINDVPDINTASYNFFKTVPFFTHSDKTDIKKAMAEICRANKYDIRQNLYMYEITKKTLLKKEIVIPYSGNYLYTGSLYIKCNVWKDKEINILIRRYEEKFSQPPVGDILIKWSDNHETINIIQKEYKWNNTFFQFYRIEKSKSECEVQWDTYMDEVANHIDQLL